MKGTSCWRRGSVSDIHSLFSTHGDQPSWEVSDNHEVPSRQDLTVLHQVQEQIFSMAGSGLLGGDGAQVSGRELHPCS